MTIEVGMLVQHKCGGPPMCVFKRVGNPDDGLEGCLYWNAVTGTFDRAFFPQDDLVAVNDRA